MTTSTDQEQHVRILRSARQMIETDQLLGMRSIPRGNAPAAGEVASATSAPEGEAMTEADRDKADRLAELCERHNRECPLVKTMPGYTNIVFGEGHPDAELMFIGEAPGADEDKQGRPFVGRAGQLLNKMIGAMGIEREQVYICNLLKVRPPNNATPTPEQVDVSAPFLIEQIAIVKPKVIVTLGAPATKFILQTKEGITRIRGRWCKAGLPGISPEIDVMPTFHPAYLLRSYTPENRKKVWSDLKQVMDKLGLESPTAAGAAAQ